MTLKTNKSISKRFKVTRNKKVLFRPMHQDHFNAKDTGNQTRRKRKEKILKGAIRRKIISALG